MSHVHEHNVEEDDEEEEVPIEKEEQDATATPLPSHRGFISLGSDAVHHNDSLGIRQVQCVGSTGNWLITAHRDRTIRLLNPFLRKQRYLPPQSAFHLFFEPNIYGKGKLRHLRLSKVVLSSSPSNGRDCIAMAIHDFLRTLAFARLGDADWTTVKLTGNPLPFAVFVEDVIYHKGHGKFYAITTGSWLTVIDITGDKSTASYITNQPFKNITKYRSNYLVEWLGEVLLVIRWREKLNNELKYRTRKFDLYKFNFAKKKWKKVKSLGEYSLFLGFNTSIAVRASDYAVPALDYVGLVKQNCVYFTDDFMGYRERNKGIEGGRDMGVYDLEDHSITPHFNGVSTSRYTPPIWVVPP